MLKPRQAVPTPAKVAPVQKKPGVAAANSQPAGDLVTTATLIRGRTYVYKDVHFMINETVVLNDLELKMPVSSFAGDLEELHSEVVDGDGDRFEKPLFDVQRDVPRPAKVRTAEELRKQTVRRLPVARR